MQGKSMVTKMVELGCVKTHRLLAFMKLMENHRIASLQKPPLDTKAWL